MSLRVPFLIRLWERVDIRDSVEECWPWLGKPNTRGYGKIQTVPGKQKMIPSAVYESCIGPLPKGHVPDHLCRNRSCCNPWHMEGTTRAENSRRVWT